MINAYDKNYLNNAQINLGIMLDYAVNCLGLDIDEFFNLFNKSKIALEFGKGNYKYITGMSGIELLILVLEKNNLSIDNPVPDILSFDKSAQYWAGWALAYYQWKSGYTFEEINNVFPVSKIVNMYNPYHEMDITNFCDRLDEIMSKSQTMTNLKKYRLRAKLSQSQLAALTDISVRTIQQYEQRLKNLNKASAENLIKLSQTLCCDISSLLEKGK